MITYTLDFFTASQEAQPHVLVSPLRPDYAPIFDMLSYLAFAVEMAIIGYVTFYVLNWLEKKTEAQYENS